MARDAAGGVGGAEAHVMKAPMWRFILGAVGVSLGLTVGLVLLYLRSASAGWTILSAVALIIMWFIFSEKRTDERYRERARSRSAGMGVSSVTDTSMALALYGGQAMILRQRLLDWWGRSYHAHRRNVVKAALLKAGERGMTKQELVETTEFSQHHVRVALRMLEREGRVKEMDGRYLWISKPTSGRTSEGSR